MKHKKRAGGFTLIELLVVITIIGLLAGLAVPAIGRALDNAKQAADVVNARQLGIIFFSLANDEGGAYPVAGRDADGVRITTPVASTTDLFEALITDKDMNEPKVLIANGKTAYKGSLSTPNLTATNVGWDYVAGQTTSSDSNIPLFLSTGAFTDVAGLTATTIPDVSPSTTNAWGNKGVVVYTVGNSSFFVKARAGGKIDQLVETSPSGTFLKP
ncbi:MAG: type II secretion system protein [Blastochloris sp.]|nr:type II secretion system protein [Blastochloris sp.]